MIKEEQAKLVDKILASNKRCDVSIDVWKPNIKAIKRILALKYDRIRTNTQQHPPAIFTVYMENRAENRTVEVTLFCNEAEAEFVRDYMKGKGGE